MGLNFRHYAVITFLTLTAITSQSGGQDLRPSDHGLAYQEDAFPPAKNADGLEMVAFFGSTPALELPEAKNITDTLWMARAAESRSREARRNHVRLGLLVASAVCGLTGVALLTVSGVVFLLRHRSRKMESEGEMVLATSAPKFTGHVANEKVKGLSDD